MGVTINYSESHLDYFTRNLVAVRGCDVATAHGYASAERITDAVEEPIEIDEAKDHLRYSKDEHDQDGNIQRWIRAARQKVEKDTGVILTTDQTWRVTVAQFPSYRQSLYLPIWPVRSIEAFSYVDRDDAEQNLLESPSNFILASSARPAELALIESASWPTDFRKFNPGTLEVVAGWEKKKQIPADLVLAILKLVGDFAGFRESAVASSIAPAPQAYEELIARWVLPGA